MGILLSIDESIASMIARIARSFGFTPRVLDLTVVFLSGVAFAWVAFSSDRSTVGMVLYTFFSLTTFGFWRTMTSMTESTIKEAYKRTEQGWRKPLRPICVALLAYASMFAKEYGSFLLLGWTLLMMSYGRSLHVAHFMHNDSPEPPS